MMIYSEFCLYQKRNLKVPIERRDAATLLPLIRAHICAGATMLATAGPLIKGLKKMPELYKHYAVNHSIEFVDSTTGEHTNTIESTWQKFKAGHKKRFGTHRSLFSTYLCDFLWRRDFSGSDILFHFWSQVSVLYPVE